MSLVGAVVVEAVWSRWHKQRRRDLFSRKARAPFPGRVGARTGGDSVGLRAMCHVCVNEVRVS